MAFHDIRFPAGLSRGAAGGPERRTEIVALANGHEERNSPWAQSRRRYDAGVGMRSLDDLAALTAFFEARAGQLHGFRWKDWADYRSGLPSAPVRATDQRIGTGDGVTRAFDLCKHYASGGAVHTRPITRPVAGTVRVALDGAEVEGWEVDCTTGRVSFAQAPGPGVAITAGFEFDVPVRFDTDRLEISVTGLNAGELPHVPVVEIRT